MSKNKKMAYINFSLFFIGWVTIFLLGADFPPPMGFIWLVPLILILDVIQSYYLKNYFFKLLESSKKLKSFLMNTIFYFVGGLIISALTSIPNFLTIDALIWIAVVTLASILYSFVFWIFNSFLYHLL